MDTHGPSVWLKESKKKWKRSSAPSGPCPQAPYITLLIFPSHKSFNGRGKEKVAHQHNTQTLHLTQFRRGFFLFLLLLVQTPSRGLCWWKISQSWADLGGEGACKSMSTLKPIWATFSSRRFWILKHHQRLHKEESQCLQTRAQAGPFWVLVPRVPDRKPREAIIFVPDNCFPFSRRTRVSRQLPSQIRVWHLQVCELPGWKQLRFSSRSARWREVWVICKRDYVAVGEEGDRWNLFGAFSLRKHVRTSMVVGAC